MKIREILNLMEAIENAPSESKSEKGLEALEQIMLNTAQLLKHVPNSKNLKQDKAAPQPNITNSIEEGKFSTGLASLAIAGLAALSASSSVLAQESTKKMFYCAGALKAASINFTKASNDLRALGRGESSDINVFYGPESYARFANKLNEQSKLLFRIGNSVITTDRDEHIAKNSYVSGYNAYEHSNAAPLECVKIADSAVNQIQAAQQSNQAMGTDSNKQPIQQTRTQSQSDEIRTQKYPDGVFTGKFDTNGRRTDGTFKYANGDVFTGKYNPNVTPADGTFKYANGDSFTGKFNTNGDRDDGTFKYANGDSFTGRFQGRGQPAYGTYKWAAGGSFIGKFDANGVYADGTAKTPGGETIEIINGKRKK